MAALIGFGLTWAAAPAFAENYDFTLSNFSGGTITAAALSAAGENEWGEDLLPDSILENGEDVDLSFDSEADTACEVDLMILDEDGEEFVFRGINVCEVTKVTLEWKGSKLVHSTEN